MREHAFHIAAHAALTEQRCERDDFRECITQRLLCIAIHACSVSFCDRTVHLFHEEGERLPAPCDDLACEQIQALNARRALVNAVQLLVAQPGLWQVLTGVAIATVNLQRERVRFEAALGGKGLRNGREQIEKLLRA